MRVRKQCVSMHRRRIATVPGAVCISWFRKAIIEGSELLGLDFFVESSPCRIGEPHSEVPNLEEIHILKRRDLA